MNLSKEQQWAQDLLRSKQQGTRNRAVPVTDQKKRLESQIDHLTSVIIQAAKDGNEAEVKRIYDRLTLLRAKQLRYALEQAPKDTDPAQTKAQVEQYYIDCNLLAKQVEQLLATNTAI